VPYFEKIPGEQIYLSPIDSDDLERYVKWLSDIEITRWLGTVSNVVTLANERAWIENTTKATDQYHFGIVLREENRLLGGVSLMDGQLIDRSATLGIFIGEAEDRSKGYGAETIRLLVDYCFRWLGLRNIDLHVSSGNAQAIACYKKAGFQEYGRRHGAVFAGGQWYDDILMGTLAENRQNNACNSRRDMINCSK